VKVYSGYVHVLKNVVPKTFLTLPTTGWQARKRLAQMRRLQLILCDRNASMAAHAAQLRTEISVRWTSGTLADVLSTAALYAVQTLDGLQFMAVPLQQIASSVESWIFRCEELGHRRDGSRLVRRDINMAAHALNECGVSTDQIRRRLQRPNTATGQYGWEDREAATEDGKRHKYFYSILCALSAVYFVAIKHYYLQRVTSCIHMTRIK